MANPSIWDLLVLIEAGTPDALGQATSANSVPVVIASDQSAIPISGTVSIGSGPFAVTQSGTWSVGRTWTLASGTDSIAAVQSGTWNINNISGTISLPTGAATESTLSTFSGKFPSALALSDALSNPTTVLVGAALLGWDGVGSQWVRIRDGGLADGSTNHSTGILQVQSHPSWYNGTTWDRARGNSTDGLLVNLGANNDVTVTGTVAATQSGTWTTARSWTLASGTDSVAAVQSGTWNITNISGTVSLPTGAATETTLSALNGKFSSATATLTNVAASLTSVTLLASNSSRKGAILYNDCSLPCYVKFGSTASTTSFTVYLTANSHLILDSNPVYTGIITGIWTTVVGNMRVTELT